jgi:5-methyltetrahydrofolate--homocysteine methyltransferase
MDVLKALAGYLEAGDQEKVRELTEQAIEQGLSARQILDDGLIAAMNRVGDLFRSRDIFLPDVLLAAKAMYAGIGLLKPLLSAEQVESRGRIVIGTVQGDLHDIGKNLVGIMLRGAGFDVIDLGNDVAPETFVDSAVREEARVIGMSALLTTTMPGMRNVVDLLARRGFAGKIKTIVGGAPVTRQYAREIGADAYAFDAASAVLVVKGLMEGS